eukprot:2944-Heterococcus_DN1.PRE.1
MSLEQEGGREVFPACTRSHFSQRRGLPLRTYSDSDCKGSRATSSSSRSCSTASGDVDALSPATQSSGQASPASSFEESGLMCVNWKRGQLLGKGAYGEVYLGLSEENGS